MSDETHEAAPTQSLSPWAIVAGLCSLGFWCPPLTVIGPILGVRALHDCKHRPDRTGRGLAIISIVVGVIATTGWILVAMWWNGNIRQPLIQGPGPALERGFAGDVPGFIEAFDPALNLDELDAAAFINAVRSRYGDLRNVTADPDAQTEVPFDQRAESPIVMHRLFFADDDVLAETEIRLFDDQRNHVGRIGRIVIRDPERGDLSYPEADDER
ncbi:MAG: DUF4190 domain-containing protein [Planctomycetota bacterium]